jgi:hypothetical protein
MSAASDCNCACPTPTITLVPGDIGSAGTNGTNGTNGVNAYTTLTTLDLTLPAAAGPVVFATSVGSSAWASIGQVIFITDGTDWGHFRVLTKPSTASFTLEWLDYDGDAAGLSVIAFATSSVSPAGIQPALSAALPTAVDYSLLTTAGAVDNLAIAAGVGVLTVPLYVNLADLANADLITAYTPGYKFKILGVKFVVGKAVTTAAKLATLTPKISGVAITGGALDLTSANCTPQGTVINSTAPVTALNIGSDSATISITGSAVTTFIEGAGWIMLQIQNMDTADAVASLSDHVNDLITSLT